MQSAGVLSGRAESPVPDGGYHVVHGWAQLPAGETLGQFRLAHDIAVAKDGAVYVVDAWGQRVQKFVAHE